MILGLATVHILKPGAGMNIDPSTLDTKALATYTAAKSLTFEDFVLNIIPTSVIDSFAKNDVLQIIFFRCCWASPCRPCAAAPSPWSKPWNP